MFFRFDIIPVKLTNATRVSRQSHRGTFRRGKVIRFWLGDENFSKKLLPDDHLYPIYIFTRRMLSIIEISRGN